MMSDYLRLRQICLVAPELEPVVDDISAIFGLQVCHRDLNVAHFGLENALLVTGTTFIEIVAPLEPGTAASRFLERSGGCGGYIALFDCPDPKAWQARANGLGVRTAFIIDQPGIYVGVQLHPRDCRAAMIEFDHTVGGEALTGSYWPAGGDGWQQHIDTGVTRGVTAVELAGPDPQDLAQHWGAILDRPVTAETDGRWSLEVGGASIRVRRDSRRERLDAVVLDVVDPARVMAEAARRGRVSGEAAVDIAGVTFRFG